MYSDAPMHWPVTEKLLYSMSKEKNKTLLYFQLTSPNSDYLGFPVGSLLV